MSIHISFGFLIINAGDGVVGVCSVSFIVVGGGVVFIIVVDIVTVIIIIFVVVVIATFTFGTYS